MQMKFGKHIAGFQITATEPKILLLGCGATRLLPRPGLGESDRDKYTRIKNLFDPTAPLNDADTWLSDKTKVPQDKFEEVAGGLREALLLPARTRCPRARPVFGRGMDVTGGRHQPAVEQMRLEHPNMPI